MRSLVVLLCLVCSVYTEIYNIVDFGAVGDGHTLNTPALLKAIATASQAGGGTVYVPSGVFVVGQFSLLSNVFLEISANGSLYASDDPTQYKCQPSYTSDTGPCDYPLLYATNASNIAIIGPGAINGGANDPPGHLVKSFNSSTNFLTPIDWDFSGCTSYGSCRPKLVVLTNCVHVRLDKIQLLNSPLWTTTLVQCRDVLVTGAYVAGDRRWPNGDGIDPVDSSDIVIENTTISTGDDCVCVITHTSYACSNITIRDSHFSSTSAAFKISTNEAIASGDIHDIFVSNLVITDTNRGIAIMPRWGSGSVYNVVIENVTIETLYFSDPWWGSAEPIYVTSANMSESRLFTGIVTDITFRNIVATSENGVVIKSFGIPIYGMVFENISITIAQFSEYARPCHDWRPIAGPQMVPAPTNAFYMDQAEGVILVDSSFTFKAPMQSYWGSCLNVSNSPAFVNTNTVCNM